MVHAGGEHSQAINLSLPAPDPISFFPSFYTFWPSGHLLMLKINFCCLKQEKRQCNIPWWRRNCVLPCSLPARASLQPRVILAASLSNVCEATRRSKLWSNPSWLWFASCRTPPATANTPLDKNLFRIKSQLTDTQRVPQLVMADFEIKNFSLHVNALFPLLSVSTSVSGRWWTQDVVGYLQVRASPISAAHLCHLPPGAHTAETAHLCWVLLHC